MASLPKQSSSKGFPSNTDVAAEYDTSNLATAWSFAERGGLFGLEEADDGARRFLNRFGFVIITNVMPEKENDKCIRGLVDDIHEINPALSDVSDPALFPESGLPTSPNRTFRTTCNIAFGRFASAVRVSPGVRRAFAAVHGVPVGGLACSWDNPFFTPRPKPGLRRGRGLALHWDDNYYYGGEKAHTADDICVQGVYYAAGTGADTPTFVASPGSNHVWRTFCENEHNPCKSEGKKILNYLQLNHFVGDGNFMEGSGLERPVRIHVPPRALLLWHSRTCHGNAPRATDNDSGDGGVRIAFAICYAPVVRRTAEVHKEALLKGAAGIRTTHNPAVMLAHDKHGYPDDFVSVDEPNKALTAIRIKLNPEVKEAHFQEMLQRAEGLADEDRKALSASGLSLGNVQERVWNSYWGRGEDDIDYFEKLMNLRVEDIRKLLSPDSSLSQGLHPSEMK